MCVCLCESLFCNRFVALFDRISRFDLVGAFVQLLMPITAIVIVVVVVVLTRGSVD